MLIEGAEPFGGGWDQKPLSELLDLLDEAGVTHYVDLDGGWGEVCESYIDRSLMGCGASTASQTAWVLLSLFAAGEARSNAAARGVEYLLSTQKQDSANVPR